MATMNLTLLLLLLLLSSVWHSMAKPSINEDGNAKDEVVSVALNAKVPREMTTTDENHSKIRGRKMSLHNVIRSEEASNKVKSQQIEDKGKIYSVRESKYKTSSSVGRVVEEVDDGGFVAFNADYHSPRHHPPKNN